VPARRGAYVTADPVKLLVVDDHPLFVEGLAALLQRLRPGWVLESATVGRDALDSVRSSPPDAVLLDVFLPDRDGFDLLHELREMRPSLPVILVSGRDHGAMAVRARSSPANGFIPKTVPGPDFVERIERVLAGGAAFSEVATASAVPVLTMRQAQVLELLAHGHGNKEIRHRLGIAERTVRAHLTELFALLGVHGRMPAVIRARELGLIA